MNLGRRNLRTEDLARAIGAPRREKSPLAAELRAVYQRQEDGPWRFMIGRCVLGAAPQDEREERYSNAVFISRTLPALTPVAFVKQLADDGFMLADDLPPVTMSVASPSWTEQRVGTSRHPSSSRRCGEGRAFLG